MQTLNGKRVLITGAASGIGKALAEKFAARGAELLLVDLNEAMLTATAKELGAAGAKVRTYRLDVTDTPGILALRDQVHRDGGPIDVLANNAGLVFGGAFLDVPLEKHLTTYKVNTLGVVAMTHAFLPDLIGRPDAHLLNTASASGFIGLPYGATYASSKWGCDAPGRPAPRGGRGARGGLAARRPPGSEQPADPARSAGLLRGCGPDRPHRDRPGRRPFPGRRPPHGQPPLLHGPRAHGPRRPGAGRAAGGALPEERGDVRANAEAFGREAAERTARWKQQAAGAPGVVFYHKDGSYLANLLNVPILGFVEPLPGIPPTAAHLKSMVEGLKGKKGVILYNTYHSADGPGFLSRNLGWPAKRLQLEPPLEANGKGYLDHLAPWVAAVASAKP